MPDPKRQTISEPGLYSDIGEDAYHADPCPEPSLSRSVAKVLVERTPRHAFIAHPRLYPRLAEPSADRFNIGTVAHTLLLGRGATIEVIDADDWRTAAAKSARASAVTAGKTPILAHQYANADLMTQSVIEQLADHNLGHLFAETSGSAEVVGAWDDPVAGWCRFMIDWLTTDFVLWDIKTTAIPLSMESVGRLCANQGYEWQAAFYERGMEALHPELKGRFHFNFLFIEIEEPFAILPVRLPNDALAKGRHNVALACDLWAKAKTSKKWPLFPPGIKAVEYPPWQVAEWAEYQEPAG